MNLSTSAKEPTPLVPVVRDIAFTRGEPEIATPVAHKCIPHTLVVLQGGLYSGADSEIWQCGVRVVDSTNAGPLSDPAGYAATIGPLIVTWFGYLSTVVANWGISQDASLLQVKVNNIGADAKYSGSGGVYAAPTNTLGKGTLVRDPMILTVATTWTTAIRTGLGSKGRVYLPWAVPSGSGLRIASNLIGELNKQGKALLSCLKQGTVLPAVVPILKASDARQGGVSYITGVRHGDVIDVQRRRKNKLRETYTAVTWP